MRDLVTGFDTSMVLITQNYSAWVRAARQVFLPECRIIPGEKIAFRIRSVLG